RMLKSYGGARPRSPLPAEARATILGHGGPELEASSQQDQSSGRRTPPDFPTNRRQHTFLRHERCVKHLPPTPPYPPASSSPPPRSVRSRTLGATSRSPPHCQPGRRLTRARHDGGAGRPNVHGIS